MPSANRAGFAEPVVHAPAVQGGKDRYQYRVGLGMIPSAEYDVFHDDFHSFVVATSITNGPVANTPWGWQGAIIDTGSTATVYTTAATGANGVLSITDATASEGVAIYGTKSVQLTAGKKFFMEIRCLTDDVTDNDLQFGLSSLTATTNPEDLWTTTATDLIAFGILDGSAYPTMLSDKSNGGTTAQAQTVAAITASAWTTLAIGYDGLVLTGWVNGTKVLTWSGAATTIPTGVALAPFFGARNGNGAGGNLQLFDYVRYSSER